MKRLKALYKLQLKNRSTLLPEEGIAILKEGSKPGDFKETCALAEKLHQLSPGSIDVVITDEYTVEEVDEQDKTRPVSG